jgi:hypothetical protein
MRWRAFGLFAALVVLVLSGCTAATKVNQSQQSYQVGSITNLKINARSASVTIATTAAGPTTVSETLRFTGDKPATTHQLVGQTFQLTETGCPGVNLRCDVEYKISVPKQTAVQISTQAGQVTVHGLAGALDVTSDAASVTGDGLSSATAKVTTKAGFVKLAYQGAPTDLSVSTDAGGIQLKLPPNASYAVQITKTVGVANVKVPKDATSPHKITAHTAVGAVTINPS